MRRTKPLRRKKPMRRRSRKQAAIYVERLKLVAALLKEHPVCQRCLVAWSRDCHEILRRSAGGDILDRDNILCLCRRCHDYVHRHPEESRRLGMLRSRYGAEARPDVSTIEEQS